MLELNVRSYERRDALENSWAARQLHHQRVLDGDFEQMDRARIDILLAPIAQDIGRSGRLAQQFNIFNGKDIVNDQEAVDPERLDLIVAQADLFVDN